jgi:hypothetical protein
MTNPLDPIIAKFRLISDAARVVIRIIENGADKAITDYNKVVAGNLQPTDFTPLMNWAILSKYAAFHGLPSADAVNQLTKSVTELDRLVVVELAAVFERTLRNHLTQSAAVWLPSQNKGDEQFVFRELVTEKIEKFEFKSELIDLFPAVDVIDLKLRMKAKQVVEFRNWVAHGKHTDPTAKQPSNVTAEDAYQYLTGFLKAAKIVT